MQRYPEKNVVKQFAMIVRERKKSTLPTDFIDKWPA